MNPRRALLAAVVLAAAVLLVPAVARAYYLQNADVAVQIAPTGVLLVTEKITIGGAFHGAFRDIPLRKGESIDRISVAEGRPALQPRRQHRAREHRPPRHLQLRDEREAGADRLALPRRRRTAHVHDLVPLPRA